ncbi:MAG: glycosyltransferase family 4 protein [Candidatus Omnitrophota bacterium]
MVPSGKRKIKVLRIITRLNIGGPAIHAVLLTKDLDRDRFETHLVSGKPLPSEGDMAFIARDKGVTVEYIPELGREIGFNDLVAFLKIIKFIRKVKPDIVHTHTAKAGTLGRLAAIFSGVPVRIHTFHGHVLDGYFSPLKTKIFIFIERFLARFTDKLITVSESVCNEISGKFKIAPAEKCCVIKLGFDLSPFLDNEHLRSDFRKRIGFEDNVLLVGIVGRLTPIKNHKMFFDVVKYIVGRSGVPEVRFIVVGDGELRGELTEYVKKLNIENCVKFIGWAEDTASVYAGLDIVVLTSLNEGTPVSLIEALASSRPVVATDVGGVRDVVKDGGDGLLAGKNDIKDFSDKLLRLLSDSGERARFGAMGRALVREKYFKDRLISEISSLYEKTLHEKGIYIV